MSCIFMEEEVVGSLLQGVRKVGHVAAEGSELFAQRLRMYATNSRPQPGWLTPLYSAPVPKEAGKFLNLQQNYLRIKQGLTDYGRHLTRQEMANPDGRSPLDEEVNLQDTLDWLEEAKTDLVKYMELNQPSEKFSRATELYKKAEEYIEGLAKTDG